VEQACIGPPIGIAHKTGLYGFGGIGQAKGELCLDGSLIQQEDGAKKRLLRAEFKRRKWRKRRGMKGRKGRYKKGDGSERVDPQESECGGEGRIGGGAEKGRRMRRGEGRQKPDSCPLA
jgi:hypothetical protein